MSISSMLQSQGEDWEVRRGEQVVGTFRGMQNTAKKNVGFEPDADVQAGDTLTGKETGNMVNVVRVENQKFGEHGGCRYAYYR